MQNSTELILSLLSAHGLLKVLVTFHKCSSKFGNILNRPRSCPSTSYQAQLPCHFSSQLTPLYACKWATSMAYICVVFFISRHAFHHVPEFQVVVAQTKI